MKYDNATLEGQQKLLIIGLLERIKIIIKQQRLVTTKTIKKSIIKYINQIYNKKIINKIKLASDKNQNNSTYISLEKTWDVSPVRLVNR